MVYKRKAHVLFVGSGDAGRAIMATVFANALGQGFMQARAVGLSDATWPPELLRVMQEVGFDAANQPLHTLSSDHLAWADLLVTLDQAAADACPTLPPQVQMRCYPFAQPENIDALRQVRDAIQQRVAGMVGGMAMLANV